MIEKFWLNESLFYWINSFSGKNEFLDEVFVFITDDLIYILIGLFFIYFLKQIFRDRKIELIELVIFFSSSIFAWVLTKLIKLSLPTERPFLALDNVFKLVNENPMSSFPSGHSTLAFALATSVFIYNKKIGWVFLLVAILVAISRILVGVHYPLDVLVGSLIGILIPSTVGIWLKKKYKK